VVEEDGEKLAVVSLTDPLQKIRLLYFNLQNGLLKKMEQTLRSADNQTFTKITKYAAFQEVEGVKLVSRLVEIVGNQQIELNATELKVNVGLKKSLFKIEQ